MAVVLTPSELNFGKIPVADHPVSQEFTVKNLSRDLLLLRFKSINVKNIWFTSWNKMVEQQRKTGFDIFYTGNKIEDLTLLPNQEVRLSCVMVPAKIVESPPFVLKIPVDAFNFDNEYSDYSGDGELIEDEIEPLYSTIVTLKINASFSKASFKIEPSIFWLNNCRIGETQTKKIKLANLCDAILPIMIHSVDDVTFVTPSLPNFINLPPNGDVEIIMNYTPSSLGQFETKIQFDCLIKTDEPNYLKILTAVSPKGVPQDFPVIQPANEQIDFGRVYAGKQVEADIHVENKGQSSYKILVYPIFEDFLSSSAEASKKSFTKSLTTSIESESTAEYYSKVTPPMVFKTASMQKSKYQIEFILDPKTSTSIQAEFTPQFNIRASPNEFDSRSFMIMMQFTDQETLNIYYKLIQCSAEVCHSSISISPTSFDFGDTVVANTTKTATINIVNHSPLPTTVKAISGSRSVVVSPIPIELKGDETVPFTFTFYPRRPNPEYTGRILFQNTMSKTNQRTLPISAIVVASEKESMHSTVYTLTMDSHPCGEINFMNCVSSFPAVKELVIKNKWDEPIEITIHTSDHDIISVYSDTKVTEKIKRLMSQPSTSIVPVELPLLKKEKPPKNLHELCESMRANSAFFKDMYTLFPKNDGRSICEHFIVQKEAFHDIINSENTQMITDAKITISPRSRRSIYVVLIPKMEPKDSNKWIHKRLSISIELHQESLKEKLPPLNIPVVFDVVTAISFISAHSLNFGKIQTDTRSQHDILIANESVVPLPFVIECDSSISIDKHPTGVILPLSSFTVPFTLSPVLDGILRNKIVIHNVFNDKEEQQIMIKANVERKSNFYVHPLEIDFGEVTAGVCSEPAQIFITNTSSENNEFTFSHSKPNSSRYHPMLMFHIKKLSERKLTEATELQIDKIQKKVIQLKRKGKLDKIIKNQRIIDDLSNTKIVPSETKLKQLDAKFMDRLLIQADPQQIDCIEVQLIPSFPSGIVSAVDIEGTIPVYEKGKAESQKLIKYKAHVVPKVQITYDDTSEHTISVEPTEIDLGQVYVHDSIKKSLTITNKSNTKQNFWFSASSSTDAIITTNTSEYLLESAEEIEMPFEVFCIQPGRLYKEISITTQSTSVKIPISGTCAYKNILLFTGLTSDEQNIIDFGTVPLTTLTVIEERKCFGVKNISDQTAYVYLHNTNPNELSIYDKDPKQPIIKPFKIEPDQTVNVNLILKPVLDRDIYRSYKSMVIEDVIMATVFSSGEEAAAYSAKPNENPDCIFRTAITVKAVIGRIGLSVSESELFFGTIDKLGTTIDAKIQVRNRSSHIPISVYASCSQGIFVSDYMFKLNGKKDGASSQELTVSFQPSSWGMNEGTLRLAIPGSVPYSKLINVLVFADQHTLTTNLPVDDRGIDIFNIGGIYVEKGKPIKQQYKIQLTNNTNQSIKFEITELKKKFFLKAKETTLIKFDFPFDNIEYDEEEPKFSYRMLCYSSSTKNVIKIINIVGFFSVSNSSFDKESITFERFGEVNHWAHNEETATIINNSNIPLVLDRVFCNSPKRKATSSADSFDEDDKIDEISTNDQFLILPDTIGPIPPNETYVLKIEPNIEALKSIEGIAETTIKYINKHNKLNVLSMKVGFNISASFVKLDHVSRIQLDSLDNKVSQFISSFKEIEGEKVASCWFGVISTCDVETTISLSSKIYDEQLSDMFAVSLFVRSTGRPVDQLVLQPAERVEIRVKVTLKGDESCIKPDEPIIAEVVFHHDGSDDLVLPIVYYHNAEERDNNKVPF